MMRAHHYNEGESMPTNTEVALLLGHITTSSTSTYIAIDGGEK